MSIIESLVLIATKPKLTLKLAVGGGGGGGSLNVGFFSLEFLSLDQLPNAFAQLFFDNEDIF